MTIYKSFRVCWLPAATAPLSHSPTPTPSPSRNKPHRPVAPSPCAAASPTQVPNPSGARPPGPPAPLRPPLSPPVGVSLSGRRSPWRARRLGGQQLPFESASPRPADPLGSAASRAADPLRSASPPPATAPQVSLRSALPLWPLLPRPPTPEASAPAQAQLRQAPTSGPEAPARPQVRPPLALMYLLLCTLDLLTALVYA